MLPFPAPDPPAGADRQRKKLLKTVPIVGVTCCSSMLAALDNQQVKLVWFRSFGRLIGPLRTCLVPVLGSGWALRWDEHSSRPFLPHAACHANKSHDNTSWHRPCTAVSGGHPGRVLADGGATVRGAPAARQGQVSSCATVARHGDGKPALGPVQ